MKINDIFEKLRKQIRCQSCGRLLLKAKLKSGCSLEIMCPRCKNINLINLYDRVDNKNKKCYNNELKKEE